MAKVYKHPISGCVYSVNEVGLVRVDDPATGRYGVFDDNGMWSEGEMRRRRPAGSRLGRPHARGASPARGQLVRQTTAVLLARRPDAPFVAE